MRWLLLTVLLAGCFGGGEVVVRLRKERGFDGAWATEKGVSRLDATGDVTKLVFRGKTYTFKGLRRYHGHIGEESVRLMADKHAITLTAVEFTIQSSRRRFIRPIAKLPPSPVIVFDGPDFFFE